MIRLIACSFNLENKGLPIEKLMILVIIKLMILVLVFERRICHEFHFVSALVHLPLRLP
ncbi:hypothetical protein D3C87_575920 [compost metagenome]